VFTLNIGKESDIMKRILLFAASVIVLIASVMASTASIFWVYQPRVPKSLR